MKQLKIGLIGAHSCGKTTALGHAWSTFKSEGKTVNIVMESAREANQSGFNLDDRADGKTQLWMLCNHINNEILAQREPVEYIFCDRTVWDTLVYARLNPKITNMEYRLFSYISHTYADLYPYDMIIFFPPFDVMIEDGVRNTDKTYQQKIHEEFLRLLEEIQGFCPVYTCKSTDRLARRNEVVQEIRRLKY